MAAASRNSDSILYIQNVQHAFSNISLTGNLKHGMCMSQSELQKVRA